MSFVHLHNHSHFSILEGLPKPADYVKKAKELGMTAVALTDTANLHGGHEFYKACKSEGIKPLIGAEVYVQSGIDPKLKHKLVLIAKSLKGYRNIITLLTQGNLETDEDKNGLSLDDIRELKEKQILGNPQGDAPTGLDVGVPLVGSLSQDLEIVCLSGPITGEIPFYILSGKTDEEVASRIQEYREIFGEENYYLELLDHRDIPRQDTVTNKLIELHKNYSFPVVACQNTYYISPEDSEVQDIIMALGTGHEVENPDRPTLSQGNYSFFSEEQMHELFGFVPEALENTVKIADMCEIEFETGGILIPTFELPEEDQAIYERALDLEEKMYEVGQTHGSASTKKIDIGVNLCVNPKGSIQKLDSSEWYLRYLSFKGLNWRFDYGLDEATIFSLIRKLPGGSLKQSLQETLPDELRALSLTYYTEEKKEILGKLTQQQQDYITRLEYELVVIHEMKFDGYFLIVADYINWARQNNIPVGPGRGSAAGSLMAFLSGITDLDPRKYGLIFERFLNPARISMPDIDTDFSDTDRLKVVEYCRDKYGADKVVQVCTFGTFAARAAVKDVGRVMGVPFQEMNELVKLIPDKPGTKLWKAIDEALEFREAYDTNETYKKIIDSALKIEGNMRQLGVHACAVIIAPEPVTNFCPLQHPPKDQNAIVTQYSAYPLEDLGLLKMDFLGLRNLSIIQRCQEILKNNKNIEFDILQVPLDDPKAFEIFAEGDTTGVFQFESDGMRKYLKDLAPDTFEDLIAMVSLYRPGPLAYIPAYIDRKYGREEIMYMTPDLEEILQGEGVSEEEIEIQKNKLEEDLKSILDVTYGIAVYQEQLMFIVQYMAGFSLGEADLLRRGVGKKKLDVIAALKKEFIEKGKNHRQYHPRVTEYIYTEMIQPAANYSFNKSHAACYAFIAYQTAYLKTYYRAEFLTAVMVSDEENMERIVMEVGECESNGIHILPPDVQESLKHFTYIDDTNVRFGLKAIKGIGEGPINRILEVRIDGIFTDLQDFIERCGKEVISKKSLEALIKSGAMDSFGERGQMWASIPNMIQFAKKDEKEKQTSQMGLFAAMGEEFEDSLVLEEKYKSFNFEATLKGEKEMIGFGVSGHALDGLKTYCQRRGQNTKKLTLDFEELLELDKKDNPEKYEEKPPLTPPSQGGGEQNTPLLKKEGQGVVKKERKQEIVQAVGIVVDIRSIITKTGKKMMFLKCEGFSYDFEVVIFPKDVEKYIGRIEVDNFVIVNGNLEINFEYKRKSIQARDIKIASITQVRDQAKDLELMDTTKRVTGMYEARASVDEPSASLSEEKIDKEKNIKEYTVIIPSHAKKEDLLDLKTFLGSQRSGSIEIFIELKEKQIPTKLSIASVEALTDWEQSTWGQ